MSSEVARREVESLPRLIERAAAALAKATTAAEVLAAHKQARFAYNAAKATAEFSKIKDAHDTVVAACRKAMGDALVIEAHAKCRLADEYDAAQRRGEVATRETSASVAVKLPGGHLIATCADLGLTREEVYRARRVRNAERENPGTIRRVVEEQVRAGKEPTLADVKRAAGLWTGSKRAGPQPKRRTTKPSVEAAAASLVLDKGKTHEEARVALGLKSVQPVKTAVAREEGRRDPQIERADLSLSAQEKFDAAIRRHARALDASFEQRVSEEIRRRLEEIILPEWKRLIAESKELYARRKALMDKATFNSIRRALHPDSRKSISDKMLGAAFDAFMALEKFLLNEKDSPTNFPGHLPSTLREWDAMRARGNGSAKKQTVRPRL